MTPDKGNYPRGVWVDAEGTLHFEIDEMIRGLGHEPTPENRWAMERAAEELAREIPGASVEVRYDG